MTYDEHTSETNRWVRNFFAGRFALLLDGQMLTLMDFGPIEAGEVRRSSLTADLPLQPGTYAVGLLVTRPAGAGKPAGGPYQHADNAC